MPVRLKVTDIALEFCMVRRWLPTVHVVETWMPSSKHEKGGDRGTCAFALRIVRSLSETWSAFFAASPIFKPMTTYGPM